jgi:hypothetical protein
VEPVNTPPAPTDFERAEMPAASAQTCATGEHAVTATYYTINGRPICEPCRERFEQERGGRGSFGAALAFGLGAAVAGAAIYYGIVAATGYELGLVAIVVGVLVGKAVRRGAGARSGWQYRGLAVFLTYLAMTATYVPLVLKQSGVHTLLGACLLSLMLPALMLVDFSNLIGLIILGIGLYEAYKLSAPPRFVLEGPFTQAAAPVAIAARAPAPPAV